MTLPGAPALAQRDIRLATTTSTDNSGLLRFVLPKFEAVYGVPVRVISVGTGKALKVGENGDVDALLVHSRPDEERFVAEGYGVNRREVMYNDFVLVGPDSDPARVRGLRDVLEALRRIAQTKSLFVSRGDDSGTHKMELGCWRALGIDPQSNPSYRSAGLGMGEVLMIASELQAYALADRATDAAMRGKTALSVLVEGDPKLFNRYGIIAVNPAKHPGVNYAGAIALIDWITSEQGQRAIADFRIQGRQVFFPSAR
ncbi:MAG TPA: substrate-binding domain-containing protein [Burkholderiales bacterium]|nr:substrate-binding domain-containing protein [Burkholderiales bacterium]